MSWIILCSLVPVWADDAQDKPAVSVKGQAGRVAAPEDDDRSQIKRWHALYQRRAEALSVVEHFDDKKLLLKLKPEALQAFSNSVRPDQVHGTVHLWTHEGRPRVIGSVWSALDQKNRSQRNLCYEFHSLAESPITARINDNLEWNPKDPGIEWILIDDMDKPAMTRPLRLAQMRRLMVQIHGEINTGESELRLLTQPIYRYPEEIKGVIDGAVFSFVVGTDPEIFVLLEVQKKPESSQPTWSMAPIRFTGAGISLKRNEKTLWHRDVWKEFARDKIYDFLYGVEHLDAVLPAGKSDQ